MSVEYHAVMYYGWMLSAEDATRMMEATDHQYDGHFHCDNQWDPNNACYVLGDKLGDADLENYFEWEYLEEIFPEEQKDRFRAFFIDKILNEIKQSLDIAEDWEPKFLLQLEVF